MSLRSASAITSTTIAIDQDYSDWTGVFADPQNVTRDTQVTDPDPDYPSQPDRDVYLVGTTWDSRFLYIYMRRTAGGTKAIAFGAYIDLGGDGLLQDSDVVVDWVVQQSSSGSHADAHASSPSAHIFRYNQARNGVNGPYLYPDGDPMGHDGETPDGWANIQSGNINPVDAMDGYLSADGIEFEGRVAWSDLGVPAGSPIAIHFADANGETWGKAGTPSNTHKWIGNPPQWMEENRGQLEDNVDPIWWLRKRGVTLTSDHFGSAIQSSTIPYDHVITNTSNTTETFDLTAVSDAGWTHSITTTGGAQISTVTLAPGESRTVRLNVNVPPGIPDNTYDHTVLTATCQSDPLVTASNTDTTKAGRITVTVTPDGNGSIAPGQTISYTFNVQNNMSLSGLFDLTTTGTAGFETHVYRADGTTPLSSVTLGSGEMTQVVVSISVPPTATVGTQDVTKLFATYRNDPSVISFARADTTVLGPLTITPNNTAYGGIGTSVDYLHTITNSWPTSRTVTLSYTDSHNWPVAFYLPDGVTRITTIGVGPYGATADIIARVSVPTTASYPATDYARITATAGTSSASATDTTIVRRLATYADEACSVPATSFYLTDEVHARGTGLSSNSTVYFVWKSPSGTIMRTSPPRTVDAGGLAWDDYSSTATDTVGGWTVELRQTSPTGTLLDSQPFALQYKAEITSVEASDAPSVAATLGISSSVANEISREITSSTMTYLVWWDSNGNATYDSGDISIDSTGAPHPYSATATTHITSIASVPASGTWSESTPWLLNNRQFPNQGNYNVTATWRTSTGGIIDVKTTQFYSIPTLGWPLMLVFLAGGGWLMWRRHPWPVAGGVAA